MRRSRGAHVVAALDGIFDVSEETARRQLTAHVSRCNPGGFDSEPPAQLGSPGGKEGARA